MVMYYQVKFEDGIYYICSKSRINKTTTSISVRYTGGAWYSATIIASNTEDRTFLVKRVGHKQHSCYFCKKVLFQLPRHWFKIHFREPEVREIKGLHQQNFQRRKKINDLRKKGDFEYNQLSVDRENIVMRNSNMADRKLVLAPHAWGMRGKNFEH
ncbi:uncharacterized protein isoform X4 [Leptinotarsa decemlineata]|uniref:uncharacterized protein isoform X4 n=1 Tax=Leptinotarsa decemlineata TaxID=7539 RepID=UPI003D309C4D